MCQKSLKMVSKKYLGKKTEDYDEKTSNKKNEVKKGEKC